MLFYNRISFLGVYLGYQWDLSPSELWRAMAPRPDQWTAAVQGPEALEKKGRAVGKPGWGYPLVLGYLIDSNKY